MMTTKKLPILFLSILVTSFQLKAQLTVTPAAPITTTAQRFATADELFIQQGSFILKAAREYRYLTIKDVDPHAQSQVFVWAYITNQRQQEWKFIPQAGGFYKIKSQSGLFLSQKRILISTVEPEANEDSQLWRLTEVAGGYYSIMSKTNKYLVLIDRQNKDGGVTGFANSSDGNVSQKWQLIKRSAEGVKTTTFNPAINGFRFANTFAGIDASYRYGGLCGGMVYAAMDYLKSRKPIPLQTYKPANRTPLQSYIYGRQSNSAQEDNWDKWQELRMDALGVRDAEFFQWGIQGSNGGRLQELRTAIDAGNYIPLGLYTGRAKGLDGYEGADHQVLAIGYAVGRYTGNLQGHPEDLRILIYNPNFPGVTMTLVPDLANKCFFEVESGISWRSYFVNNKYRAKNPPDIATLNANEPDGSITHVYATFQTGGDDLRGGNDNVSLTINYKDGSSQTFPNVNGGARWVDNYDEAVPLVLNKRISKADIRDITLTTSFGGGLFGDNWNLDWFCLSNGGDFFLVCKNTLGTDPKPLMRFTGEQQKLIIPVL